MIRCIALACLLPCMAAVHAADSGEIDSFRVEVIGRVRVEDGGEGRVARVVPASGLPLRLESSFAGDWRRWDGIWVEVDGSVAYDGIEPVMRVWEISGEDDRWSAAHPAVETEGVFISRSGVPVLRTADGNAPLVGYTGSFPPGARIEVKGHLVVDGGRLAIQVAEAKWD